MSFLETLTIRSQQWTLELPQCGPELACVFSVNGCHLTRILGGEGAANQPGGSLLERPFLRLFLENEHEVGQKKEQVDGAEQNIGASDGEGQHTHHKGEDQEDDIDRVDPENDR